MNASFLTLLLCSAITASAGSLELLDGTRLGGALHWRTNGLAVQSADGTETVVELSRVRRALFVEAQETNAPPKVIISTNHAIPLDQSATDSLNGLVGYLRRPDQKPGADKEKKNGKPGLTDAKNTNAPTEDNGWFAGEVTWDLGAGVPAAERQLDAVDIWIRAHDAAHCDYSGALAISTDGEDFVTLADTVFENHFGEPKHQGNAEGKIFNRVRYQFAPGAVTDFRYLRFIAEVPPWTGNDSRFVEVDGFISRGPARPRNHVGGAARVLSRHGSELCGTLKSIDAHSVTLLCDGVARKLPLPQISRVIFRRLEPAHERLVALGRTGVLLRGGDFIEGEIDAITDRLVTVNSVLFGMKRLELSAKVAAILFSEPWKENAAWDVRLADGSRLRARTLKITADTAVELDELTLGKIKLPGAQIYEINFTSGAAPRSALP